MGATPQIESSASPEGATFVGRVSELDAFAAAFGNMLAGRRQILTLAGEPGIGKTRLAEAFADAAEDQGSLVIWGRCYEEPGAPPYWPWVQALREFVAGASPSELMRAIGNSADEIMSLVPELKTIIGGHDSEQSAPLEPGAVRFRTFDAIARFLQRAAEQVPLVLIMDNAHWADKASLAMVEFVSQQLSRSRLLLICTYRDTEISRQSPLAATLGELSRDPGMARLKLGGIDRSAITRLAGRMLGRDLPADVIAAIDQQTDGNPLFVIELLKELIEESREAGVEPIEVRIPDGVRETIGRRLSRLPDSVNDLLRAGSVLGREFEAGDLAQVSGRGVNEVLSALHLAESAGFVEVSDDQPGAYRFTHALIRETLYDEIPTPERLRLHGLAGDALVQRDPQQKNRRLSQIAHHFFESAALGGAEKAADYAERAGREAMRLSAYEEADIQYGRLLDLLNRYGVGDADAVQQALFCKSRAKLGCGDVDGSAALLVESISDGVSVEHARSLVDVVTLWVIVRSDSMQVEQLPIVRRMLELLPDVDSAERAKLLAAQALAERTLGTRSRIRGLVDESIAMARRLGDPEILCACLRTAFLALNGDPTTLTTRTEIVDEFIRIAPAADQNERLAEAMFQQALNLIEAGRIDGVELLLDDYEKLKGARVGLNQYRAMTLRIVISLLRGEYEGLEDRMDELRLIGRRTRAADADGVYGVQMFTLNRDLGRLARLAPVIERFAASPVNRAWTPGLILALTEAGKPDAASRKLEQLSADDFSAIPNDDLRATSLVYCAEACVATGDGECARKVYEQLLPYAGTFSSHPTAVCLGSNDLFLGMLAATVGDLETARQHFDSAISANSAARAWPWLARTCYRYAQALRGSDELEDLARANELLREAEQIASSLGMDGLASDVDVLLRGDDAREIFPDGLTPREVDVLRLLAIGRSNKDVAKVLSISLNTVATHVRNILTKTECANRTEAAAYAARNGLIESH